MPANYAQYPLDWFSRIRPEAIERVGNACEKCKATNYSLRYYSNIHFCHNESYAEARQRRFESGISDVLTITVLTVHHIDRFPMNNDPKNLRVLCLECANRIDAKRRANVRRTKALNALEEVQPSLPLVTSIISKL